MHVSDSIYPNVYRLKSKLAINCLNNKMKEGRNLEDEYKWRKFLKTIN